MAPYIEGFSWEQFFALWPSSFKLEDNIDYSSKYFTNLKIYISMLNEGVKIDIQELYNTHTNSTIQYSNFMLEEETIQQLVTLTKKCV